MDKTCGDCQYYHKYKSSALSNQGVEGECRQGPPQVFAVAKVQEARIMNPKVLIDTGREPQTKQITVWEVQSRYPPLNTDFPACGQFSPTIDWMRKNSVEGVGVDLQGDLT